MTISAVLILARTLHIIATLQLAGLAVALVVLPAPAPALARMRRLGWSSLAVALVSAAAWVAALTAQMNGHGLTTVLGDTQFGHSFILRAVLLGALALLLAWSRWRWLAMVLGAAAAATLAWAGHAGAGEGLLHLAADVVHVLAAAAWLGGLLPLALVLHHGDMAACSVAARRFSRLGVAAVLAVVVSGLGNAYFLIGSLAGLLGTPYGHLLLVKLALFGAMLSLAAYNRQILTPRLASGRPQMIRNTLTEAVLAVMLVGIVGALGTMAPAIHGQVRWPLPYRLDGGHLVPATPMSFTRPVTRLTTEAVAQGRRLYAETCAGCHPAGLQISNQGDIYWWATQGHAAPPLASDDGWNVVHYLTVRAQGASGPAPDFDFATPGGEQGSLVDDLVTLLVFYDDSPPSRTRLSQLSMNTHGRRVLAVPLQSPAESELSVTVTPDVVEAYGVLLPHLTHHTELLVDEAGRIRARSVLE